MNMSGQGLNFQDFTFTAETPFQLGTYTLFQTAPGQIVGALGTPVTQFMPGGQFLGTITEVGGDQIDLVIQTIPEPNALSMLAGSFGMALGLQRFRRRRRES